MGKINLGRVLLGGILAGLIANGCEYVINQVVLAEQWQAMARAKALPALGAGGAGAFTLVFLGVGLVAVWTYAAIRPRFGAGPKTAVIAGLLTWITAYLLNDLAPLIFGVTPPKMFLIQIGGGLVEIVLATAVGAFFYKEKEAA